MRCDGMKSPTITSTTFQSRRARIQRKGSKTCQTFHFMAWTIVLFATGGTVVSLATMRLRRPEETMTNGAAAVPPPPSKIRHRAARDGEKTARPPRRKYGKLILFLHIHKSAGGFLCKRGFENRLSALYASNCNARDDQRCCGPDDSLESLRDFARSTPLDLVATERELHENMDTSVVDYAIALRDSKSRYYSHYQHVLRHRAAAVGKEERNAAHETSEWLGLINAKNAPDRFDSRNRQEEGDFTSWSEGQPDNWNVRILCGSRCKISNKFQITRELFEYTLNRLDKFRHVLFVEDMRESYNRMASAYQWKPLDEGYMMDDSSTKPTRRGVYDRTQVAASRWNPLMSILDDALYEFAKRKYNRDNDNKNNQSDLRNDMRNDFANQAQVDEYFALGPSQNCTNVCCGSCTQY